MSLAPVGKWLRKLNPLRTLAGQLILVTIIAVILSHAIAWVLFARERGHSMRLFAENINVERIAAGAERVRESTPSAHAQIAMVSSDYGVRFDIVSSPQTIRNGRVDERIASAISQRLNGVATQAIIRTSTVVWPPRFEQRHGPGGPYGPGHPPDRDNDGSPDSGSSHSVDELIVYVPAGLNQTGAQEWLRARAFLPTPRPVPTSLWFSALFSVIAVGIAAALIARRIGAPLAQLTKAADRLGAGDMKVKTPESGPEDIRRASAAFNAMAERLGRQMERQRQMLWALSHDLRTPITALRLRAELLDDETARQRMLNSLADMETLTEQALALARAGASKEDRVRVDLSEIAHTLCGELQELGLNIGAVAPQPIFAECRPDEIVRAMRNLVENAQKYAGGGEMHVSRDGKSVVIEVLDNGPGIAEAEISRVTDPFFRADQARSQGADGVGLGLAIAQAIADSHGGTLILHNRTPHGLSAKLILPG